MAESLTPSKPRERALTKTETKTRLAALTAPVTVPVLLPLALPAPYDYLVPEGMKVEPGQFVVAPLATVEYLAVVWPRLEGEPQPKIERTKLREIVEVLDDVPKLPRVSLDFADWVARSGRPRYTGYLPYYVAKAGIIALTEALALELAPDQILVNAIAPGPIVAPEGVSDDEFAAVERATPLGHWGGENEIAKAVLALVESDFITGETIRVDGGRHLR